jgi:hypothetical protein
MTASISTIGVGVVSLKALASVAESLGIELIILSEGLSLESLGESCVEYLIPWPQFTPALAHQVMLQIAEEELQCS